ncbi:hypothetical protein KC921_04855 [Candidatus Woesebacteria bacterium]|nr:hypothetical protein [Candidatus Woesebacteria bacterium]
MQNVEKTQLVRSNELEPVRIQTLIIGRGAVGSMFQRELSGSQQKSETPATKEQQADVQIISHREITPATLASAELIILATPNHSVEEMITEILERAEGELPPILLIQNGVGVVEKAHAAQLAIEATGRPHQELHLIRASVFTQVSQTDDELAYNDKKLRIALANAGCTQLQLSMVKTLLEQAGFQVLTGEKQKNGAEDAFDYKELEEMKLLANMIGASSTVTGMSPKETFADPDLFDIELEAFSDRLDLLRVKNKNLLDIGWIKTSFFPMFKAVSKLGRHSGIVRSLFALVIAKQRNNQPSAAWSRVEVNGDITEAIHYFSAWSEISASVPDEDRPALRLDRAMVNILSRQASGELQLGLLKPEARKRILLEALKNPDGYEPELKPDDYLPKEVEQNDVDPTDDTQS